MSANATHNTASKHTNDESLDASAIISEVSGLISPPSICVRLYELIHSSNASAQTIGDTLALDPNLVARVLKIVNSAAYNFPNQITTVNRAVTIIGTQDLCNLVMAIAAVRSFSKFGGGLYSVEEFWQHSVFVALCARHLARGYKLEEPESFFVAGLLHDIGIPILYSTREKLCEIVKHAWSSGEQEHAIEEQKQFGIDHGEIAGLVLKNWQLPEKLTSAISFHHQVTNDPAPMIIRLADQLSNLDDFTADNDERFMDIGDDRTWEVLGSNKDNKFLDEVLDKVKEEYVAVVNALIS